MGAVRLPEILVLTIDDFISAQCTTSCWGKHVPFGPTLACNVSSWDGIVHWAPKASQLSGGADKERALAMLWNPRPDKAISVALQLPVYYAGLAARMPNTRGVSFLNARIMHVF